jgi:hypothetical protein
MPRRHNERVIDIRGGIARSAKLREGCSCCLGSGMIKPDTAAYLVTWAEEIASRLNRVRNIIGAAHWPSDGAYKEHLLREILERHLPNYLITHRGFIRDILHSQACSPEVDILVSNPAIHVPIFHEGGLQIAAPSAVLATAEVKSSYSVSTLRDAFLNVTRVRALALSGRENADVWSSIVFTDSSDVISAGSLLADVERALPACSEVRLLPQCVAIANSAIAILDGVDTELRVRAFECRSAALALALAYIFGHVQASLRQSSQPGELEEILRNIDFQGPQVQKTMTLSRAKV